MGALLIRTRAPNFPMRNSEAQATKNKSAGHPPKFVEWFVELAALYRFSSNASAPFQQAIRLQPFHRRFIIRMTIYP